MISVTVAAHGLRNRKTFGAHFKSYDSGRLHLKEVESDEDECGIKKVNCNSKTAECYLFEKILNIFLSHLLTSFSIFCKYTGFYIPFLYTIQNFFCLQERPPKRIVLKNDDESNKLCFDKTILRNVFSYLDYRSIIRVEKVCREWKRIVKVYSDEFDKCEIDQVKINLDEGQIIMFSLDQKKDPIKYNISSIKELQKNLKNIKINSLYIRGMILSESKVVLNKLNSINLKPSQVYFLYCEFDVDSISEFEIFFNKNKDNIVDLGIEDCLPNGLLSDKLFTPSIPILTQFRIINTISHAQLAITDHYLFKMKEIFMITKQFPLQSLYLCEAKFSIIAFIEIIMLWKLFASQDLSITLQNTGFDHIDFISQCQNSHVVFNNKGNFIHNQYVCHVNIINY